MNNKKNIPTVLIFDSGIGGLSVYDEIHKKMPNLNYLYVFDNEMFPYGDKSSEFLIERVTQVIVEITKTHRVDLAVIACNTASTICLPSLRSQFSFPIVGVVPAIKPARRLTKNRCIGLLATKATILRGYTTNLIQEYAADCHVELLGLSELALIAENKLQGIAVNMDELRQLLTPWQQLKVIPDTIVLGCTHYPFIKEELAEIFPKATFIDSGYAIAERVYHVLSEKYNLGNVGQSLDKTLLLSTIYNENVKKIINKFNDKQSDKFKSSHYQLINMAK